MTVTPMWSRYSVSDESPDGVTATFRATTGFQLDHATDATDDDLYNADSSLPQYGDTWPGRPYVFLRARNIERIGPGFSQIIYEFSGEVSAQTEAFFNQLPKWSWSSSLTTEPVDVDARGVPFVNAIGEVKEGFTKEISDFTLTVERPFQSINTFALVNYLDSVNLHPWGSPDSIWPAGTAALRNFTAASVQNGADVYYNVTATIDFRVPYRTIPARAWWHRYRNDGLNHVSGDYVSVTFSGGGAVRQAKGYVVLTSPSSGGVSAVAITDPGSGYISAPTVTITGSVGSGATATATVANGEVTGVTIGAAGSGYKQRIVRAVDGNKEPESRPVLLKADGRREYNASAAIFIERPKKQFILPYSGLGLF